MGESRWVDYRMVKEAVTVEQVLAHYGILAGFRPQGSALVGACPIHKGHSTRQFKLSPSRRGYHCFGSCNKGGNVLDLTAALEGISIREAALFLADTFQIKEALRRPEKRERVRAD